MSALSDPARLLARLAGSGVRTKLSAEGVRDEGDLELSELETERNPKVQARHESEGRRIHHLPSRQGRNDKQQICSM